MTDNTERDELADAVRLELSKGGYQMPCDGLPYQWQALCVADAVLAAGYRKPRTITFPDGLDVLADGTIIKDRDCALEKSGGRWVVGDYENEPILPAIVLWEPNA